MVVCEVSDDACVSMQSPACAWRDTSPATTTHPVHMRDPGVMSAPTTPTHRDPPPYPGNLERSYFLPGCRQSQCSDSDGGTSSMSQVSSSESLNSRQDPQGEETVPPPSPGPTSTPCSFPSLTSPTHCAPPTYPPHSTTPCPTYPPHSTTPSPTYPPHPTPSSTYPQCSTPRSPPSPCAATYPPMQPPLRSHEGMNMGNKTLPHNSYFLPRTSTELNSRCPDSIFSQNRPSQSYVGYFPPTSYMDYSQFFAPPDIYSVSPFSYATKCVSSPSDNANNNASCANSSPIYANLAYNSAMQQHTAPSPATHQQSEHKTKHVPAPIQIKNNKNRQQTSGLNRPEKLQLSHSYPPTQHARPPPDYPGHTRSDGSTSTCSSKSDDKSVDLSRSYDGGLSLGSSDLSSGSCSRQESSSSASSGTSPGCTPNQSMSNQHLLQQAQNRTQQSVSPVSCNSELEHTAIAARATQMVERLSEENNVLRKTLETYYNKVSKLQKFEHEIQKVQGAYESLVKHSQKRENLEKVMRYKLDCELRKINDINRDIKDQLDKALAELKQKEVYNLNDCELKKEITKKDSTIAKIIAQHRELGAGKDRLEVEVAAQRATLSEQRTHIEVLDGALGNAHANIMRIEEQLRLRAGQDGKVEELEQAVAALQRTSEKREAIESRLRARLQEQLKTLRAEQAGVSRMRSVDSCDEGIASDNESPRSSRAIHPGQGGNCDIWERDDRILELEAEVLKWEQRYLEEAALRQLAVDAASMPKDVRIAALEQSSVETEKILADARHERLAHLEEVYQAHRRVAQLEAKVKTQAAQLAEKSAMIDVLQRHGSGFSRNPSINSSFSSILGSPMHSLRASPTGSPGNAPSPPPRGQQLSLNYSLERSHVAGYSPPSSNVSRQGSHIDPTVMGEAKMSCVDRDISPPQHSSTNSTYSCSGLMSGSLSTEARRDAQVRLLQHKLAAQAALFRSLQSDTEQISAGLWQV